MLVPCRPDVSYFHDWVVGKAAEVKFIRGRLKYTLHGIKQNSAPFPSMLVRYGGEL